MKALFYGKKGIINHVTKIERGAEGRAEMLRKKGFLNVQIKKRENFMPELFPEPKKDDKKKKDK